MQILSEYLRKHSLHPPLIQIPPTDKLYTIIVIPCFNEPDVIASLDSLKNCNSTKFPVEILIVLNHSIEATQDILNQHHHTAENIKNWITNNTHIQRRFHLIEICDMPAKDAGVGLARKTGMDEAVRRLLLAGNPDGIIAGFDADCICDANYLSEIEIAFLQNQRMHGASVYFEHPMTGSEFESSIYDAIIQYELHLRYYKQALYYTGFPYAFHTVGSSFVVRADTYCMQGGMNKKKAGEDFYFLSKVIPHGKYGEINSTRVVPSPRLSDRVPFGTGAAIGKMIQKQQLEFLTYPFELFLELKSFFSKLEQVYILDSYFEQESILSRFMSDIQFDKEIMEIIKNTSSFEAFYKRFFLKFNAFKILKFFNYAVGMGYAQSPVVIEAQKLAALTKMNFEGDAGFMLENYRSIDRRL
ncbi:MAG: hypothetical protein CVU05_07375 [Bacteroidetes bacterium HGW-Bacteroidetes-21]|jgi:glycosyltransferase involved in cell wall biosynthesis|nr:MAG: hypothetical protein CVU05_07375 [Bacteroidetes bacterium HGW-Bacteroidetes-21]